jgi:hypothetical protein
VPQPSVERPGDGVATDHPLSKGHLDDVAACADSPLQRFGRRRGTEALLDHGLEDRPCHPGSPRASRATVVRHGGSPGAFSPEGLPGIGRVPPAGGVEGRERDGAGADAEDLATGGLRGETSRLEMAAGEARSCWSPP